MTVKRSSKNSNVFRGLIYESINRFQKKLYFYGQFISILNYNPFSVLMLLPNH